MIFNFDNIHNSQNRVKLQITEKLFNSRNNGRNLDSKNGIWRNFDLDKPTPER